MIIMAKGDRVTISRANQKGSHYIISLNGRGMTMAHTKEEALQKQKTLQRQVHKNKY